MYDVNGFVTLALEALSVTGWVATAELRVVKLFGPEGNVPITALDEEVFEEKFFFPICRQLFHLKVNQLVFLSKSETL